jgi:urease accessory protein
VAARAHHLAGFTADLADGSVLTVAERVLLGRTGEEPGRWTGTTRIERAGRPLLHTTIGLGPGQPV